MSNKRPPTSMGAKKRGRGNDAPMMEGENGMGTLESQFDDDFSDVEDDGEVVDCNSENEDDNEQMDEGEDDEAEIARRVVYRPGIDEMPDGAEMTYDSSAYDMYHKLSVDWPCLSFDIVADSLGAGRTKYPMTCYWACGSQAASAEDNYVGIMKSSQLCKTRYDGADESGSDDDDDDDEDEDINPEQDPVLETKLAPETTAFNRIRCMPQRTTIVAGWCETGVVKILDFADQFKQLDNPGAWVRENVAAGGTKAGAPPRLLYTTPTGPNGHTTEGYGLAWSPCASGSLASGDCDGNLRLWSLNEAGNVVSTKLTDGPAPGSIEDIKWSSQQSSVLITALSGGYCQVYDTRAKNAKITWTVNEGVDVNVLDWNPHRESNHLVSTGSDDGGLHIWDLRKIQKGTAEAAQTYTFLKSPITSMEYSPFNENLLAVASDDNQVSLWDFSIERDAEEEAVMAARHPELAQFPAQLVFQHMGLQNPKELHWHPQIPCVVIVTDLKGFDIFKPSNWKSLIR